MKLFWFLGLFSCLVAAKAEFSTGDQNRFAAKLYQEVTQLPQQNFIISPISVEAVLALTHLGAQGETADELRSVLSLPANQQETSSIFSTLMTSLNSFVTFANKMFIQNNYAIKEDFLNNAKDAFQADAENVDFNNNEEAAQTINKWVEQKTNEKITKMVDPDALTADTKIILVNALYFKADWETQFGTSGRIRFHVSSTQSKFITFMLEEAAFNYYDSPELNAEFLELPYKGNNDMSMVIALPKDTEGLAALENNIENVLAAKQWTNQPLYIAIPKFNIENNINMKNILDNMGIKKIFAPDADLSGIAESTGELTISGIVQKTFIRINEVGTEAAAATQEDFAVRQMSMTTRFFANHPFLFYIQSQGTILFVGRFVDQ